MAAPKLQRYAFSPTAATTWQAVHAAVPAARALVVSRLTVAALQSTRVYVAIAATAGGGDADRVMQDVALAAGEVYTESGLVIPAGQFVSVYATVITGLGVGVFGQEVDN